jgi:hypothetical protein
MASSFLSGATRDKKVLHKVVIDGKNYPYYAVERLYKEIGSTVGVSLVKNSDDLENDFNIKSMLAAGKIRFLKCSDVEGNVYRVICAGDNVKTAIGNLKKKTIDTKAINTVWLPGRVTYI